MQRWEYMTWEMSLAAAHVETVNGEEDHPLVGERAYDALKQVGAQGWELVGIDSGADNTPRYVLKRPRQ